jgi:hypothetical protein
MDYNLKKENRKKFQDKTKLKRHHKKNYAKVTSSEDPSENRAEEQERPREFDVEGVPILYSDEEFDLEGRIVLKGTTNDFRYKEALYEEEEAGDLKEYDIDFKQNLDREISFGKKEKKLKDLKTHELLQLKIVDSEYEDAEQEDGFPAEEEYQGSPRIETARASQKKDDTKLPPTLRPDEEFLDDLL